MKKTFFVSTLLCLFITALHANEWKVTQFVDDFGDKIPGSYGLIMQIENADMYNSATNDGDASILIQMDNPEFIYFGCHDYGFKNSATKFYDLVEYGFKNDKGKIFKFYIDDKIGRSFSGLDAVAIRNIMSNSSYVKAFIRSGRTKYQFTIDTSDFQTHFIEFLQKSNLTNEEIENTMNIENRLYTEVYKVMKAELDPYNLSSDYVNSLVLTTDLYITIEKIKSYFPDYYDGLISKLNERTYQEWIDHFSEVFDIDITTAKNMKAVEELFNIIEVPITPLEEEKKSTTAIDEDVSNIDTSDTPSKEIKPLPTTNNKESTKTTDIDYTLTNKWYMNLSTYGLGFTTLDGTNKQNCFSGGFMYNAEVYFNKNHGMHFGFGIISNKYKTAFEINLGYSFRHKLTNRLELNIRTSFAMNNKEAKVKKINSMSDNNIQNYNMTYMGFRGAVGCSYYLKKNWFSLNFGIADRILGKGIDLDETYETIDQNTYENVIEGYAGLTFSF